MPSLRRVALAIAVCSLVLTSGCGFGPYSLGGGGEDQEGVLTIANNDDESHKVIIFIDGKQKSVFNVDPGEEIEKPEYFVTDGEHNVTINAAGSNYTVRTYVDNDGEEYSASDVDVEITPEGDVVIGWGSTDD